MARRRMWDRSALTETILDKCSPAKIEAVDPARMQIECAQNRVHASNLWFGIIDARSLSFSDQYFDVAVAALVINFIPDRHKAISEMRRVVRPGGTVAAYVWDFAGRRGSSHHLSSALRQLGIADTSGLLNADSTTLEELQTLFESVQLKNVATRAIEIQITYVDFDDYWKANTGSGSPAAAALRSASEDKQQRLKELVRANLPIENDGVVSYPATVNAIKGLVNYHH